MLSMQSLLATNAKGQLGERFKNDSPKAGPLQQNRCRTPADSSSRQLEASLLWHDVESGKSTANDFAATPAMSSGWFLFIFRGREARLLP